ncbi:MAG: transcription termination/antitermination protein NusG, partial [Acutalibacteraceae bacterium]|nr:transcription termination/antitermination protein NusG [Acutalibacteraceae bacterium]
WFIVRNIRGVTGFVGANSTAPVPLSDKEVEKLGVEKHEVVAAFSVGDNVKIVDGPLVDVVGIIDEIRPEDNYVRVVISMFGHETPVELEINQISQVD